MFGARARMGTGSVSPKNPSLWASVHPHVASLDPSGFECVTAEHPLFGQAKFMKRWTSEKMVPTCTRCIKGRLAVRDS